MVDAAIPGVSFPPQRVEVGDSSFAETLPGEDTDFDFRLVEPASMLGRVVNAESAPNFFAANLRARAGPSAICADGCSSTHHQMDRFGLGIL